MCPSSDRLALGLAFSRRRRVGGGEQTATLDGEFDVFEARGRGAADTYAPHQQPRLGFAE